MIEARSIGGRANERQRAPRAAGGAARLAAPARAARFAAAAALAAAAACAAPPAPGVPHGTLERVSLRAPSLHDQRRGVRVYLPPSYADSTARRYPLLLLLHGWPGSDGNWPGEGHAIETLDGLIGRGDIPEVIVLFPDGSGTGTLGRSMWLDSWDGRGRLEEFLVHDLVPWADSTFRTLADPRHRGAIGLSDGGLGAWNLAIRHPDLFGAAGAHSTEFLIRRDFSSRHLFGPEPGGAARRAEYSPLLTVSGAVATLRRQALYFDCGRDDERAIVTSRALDARLDSLGVPHTFHEYPGSHTWGYWRTHLPESLREVTAGMR